MLDIHKILRYVDVRSGEWRINVKSLDYLPKFKAAKHDSTHNLVYGQQVKQKSVCLHASIIDKANTCLLISRLTP
tara:strand:- start:36248 stop:36472 length:225 start_codon:yes stop_codon:yes gene_type:complete